MQKSTYWMILSLTLLAGCSTVKEKETLAEPAPPRPAVETVAEPAKTATPEVSAPAIGGKEMAPAEVPGCLQPGVTRISSVGYGATSTLSGLSPGQKKLLGMRASKLDAYRALAEQVAGVRVMGQSTVADMMAKNETLRLSVDAHVRGARVVSVTPMSDGNYETILEIELDNRFYANACQSSAAPSSMSPAVFKMSDSTACGARCSGASGSFYYGE